MLDNIWEYLISPIGNGATRLQAIVIIDLLMVGIYFLAKWIIETAYYIYEESKNNDKHY